MSEQYNLINGDSLEVLKTFPDNHFDSIVTDPPYELGFMSKSWDRTGIAFNVDLWKEALRVLKPGGHLVAFSGSRTYHRMAVAIEDSGFEIRDQIMWVYGSGFPKSLSISKAIDKKAGAEREIIGKHTQPAKSLGSTRCMSGGKEKDEIFFTAPSTEEAKQWDGWGTALKPAHEPIVLARKPLSEKTVSENVLKWGTGGLNINGCRVEYVNKDDMQVRNNTERKQNIIDGKVFGGGKYSQPDEAGRWPANFVHDGLDTEWSRFFYCPKASKKDRNDGLDEFEEKQSIGGGGLTSPLNRDGNIVVSGDKGCAGKYGSAKAVQQNNHPTVKPTDLMAYLCRLITPPGGLILDPFNGSGSTGKAAVREKFRYVGIDLSQEYLDISKARIENELNNKNNI